MCTKNICRSLSFSVFSHGESLKCSAKQMFFHVIKSCVEFCFNKPLILFM